MPETRNYKTEGNIIYPDGSMLTWGPFYYHSHGKAKDRMESLLQEITDWCNQQDPSLNIAPTNIVRTNNGSQIGFHIQAWKDSTTLMECIGLIELIEIFFED